jgi:hypothetical protein
MRLCVILAISFAAALPALAEDFWTVRHPDQWSEQEIKRMVTDSPWARELTARVKGSDALFESPLSAGEAAPAPRIVVRWDSAAPVAEACAKGGMERYLFSCASKLLFLSGLSQKFEELSKEFYIVSMSNYPNTLGTKERDAPQHSDAANAALERLSDRVRKATFLKRKGKDPIEPARVVALPAGQALLLMVFFSRAASLTFDDGEVVFESADRTMEFKTKFNLRKMIYRGKLAL